MSEARAASPSTLTALRGSTVISKSDEPLSFREQYDESIDGRREGGPRARALPYQCDHLWILGQKVELRGQGQPQAFQRPAQRERQLRQRPLQLAGGLGEHGLEEAALRVVVVEQQLLVDACPARDLFYARTREAALGELFAGCRDNT